MIQLVKGTASESIIVTLTENKTLSEPYYLFIFTHTLTRNVVKKIFAPADDLSDYPSRYNKFEALTVSLFLNQPTGEWLYEVWEQNSSSNTDPDNSTSMVENGKMHMLPASADVFEVTQYNEQTTYKVYNG